MTGFPTAGPVGAAEAGECSNGKYSFHTSIALDTLSEMDGPRKLDNRKFPFNYRVADEKFGVKPKLGSAKGGHIAAADEMRLSDVQCALDELLAKHCGTGRSRLYVFA